VAERAAPRLYSIAAHRGFADALVAGLVPRYAEEEFGLARLTLLLPSSRAIRTVSEAFVRHAGEHGLGGLLMPRMAAIGDLDLDETLGPLLDPLGAAAIPPAADPTRRWLELARLVRAERPGLPGAAALRLAREIGAAMDRLLVEDVAPEDLLGERVLDLLGDLAGHWKDSLRLFARVQAQWLAGLAERGEIDAAARRNLLFDHAAQAWRARAPDSPVVAAGVTSAAPALARLLRVVAEMEGGAVVLPDLDLALPDAAWDELGRAGQAPLPGDPPFARGDKLSHPQYHLKLLLNRMGVRREEVEPWHRRGLAAARPERSHAISSLFLPPEASKGWAELEADKRRLSGVRILRCAHPEEEAQAIALLVREALEQPEKRVALVTPDRGLAGRVVAHLRRWNIEADDSAGRPLALSAAGRVLLLLAEMLAERAAPVPLFALLEHPLVGAGEGRPEWLEHARLLERELRGPRPAPGLDAIGHVAATLENPALSAWWSGVEIVLAPLLDLSEAGEASLAAMLDRLVSAGEALCGEALWAREDGRALAGFVEELRGQAQQVGTVLDPGELHTVLREAMAQVAVRPPYGGHPRVAIYGLLEARMSRAELVICAGLNEGSWPQLPAPDPLLPPAILRALGVPGAEFRIGLAAHDLAAMLGAPEVVLSRSQRDADGPALPSRFLLRIEALLGRDLLPAYCDDRPVALAQVLDRAPPAPDYPRPEPMPAPGQRRVAISVTALDRLRSDPYQFYAQAILGLRRLDALDAEPSAAWQGTAAHAVLERWHREGGALAPLAETMLGELNAHPLMLGLWRPRLMAALEWVEQRIASEAGRVVAAVEQWGEMEVDGVRIHGRADRIDRLADGRLAIVDYKTGQPPSGKAVAEGFALQLGLLGLMARAGGLGLPAGEPNAFEYWSLARNKEGGFGYVDTPLKLGRKRSGVEPEEFLPMTEAYLREAIARWILGSDPFTARLNPDYPGYADYDQLMRLEEWQARLAQAEKEP